MIFSRKLLVIIRKIQRNVDHRRFLPLRLHRLLEDLLLLGVILLLEVIQAEVETRQAVNFLEDINNNN